MRFVWRHKLFFGFLLLVATAIGGAVSYANAILTGLMPGYLSQTLGGKVTLDRATGSLFHGIRVLNVKYYPQSPAGLAPTPLFTAKELRIGCNLLKSVMLKDRYLTITALEPRIETDVDEVLFDPAGLLALPPLLKQHGVMVTVAMQNGSSRFTSSKRPPMELSWELDATLTAAGTLTLTAPVQHAMASATVRVSMDLLKRQGSAESTFSTSYLARHPIQAAGWSFGTPIEGKATAQVAIVDGKLAAPERAMRLPFGKTMFLDVTPLGTLTGRAGVLECAERKLRVIGVTTAGTIDRDGLRIVDGLIPLFGGTVIPTGFMPDYDASRSRVNLKFIKLAASAVPGLETFTTRGTVDGTAVIAVNRPMTYVLDCVGLAGDKYAFDKAHVEGSLDGPKVELTRIVAESQGGTGVATGAVDLDAHRMEIGARFEKFPYVAFKPILETLDQQDGLYTGTLQGTAKLSPFESERWVFDFVVDRAMIHQYKGSQARMKGVYENKLLKMPKLELDRPEAWSSARFELEKSAEGSFKMKGTVKGLEFAKMSEGFAGRADFNVSMALVNGRLVETVKGDVQNFGAKRSAHKVPSLAFRINGTKDGGHDVEITDRASYQVSAHLPEATGKEFSVANLLKKPFEGTYRVADLSPFAELLSGGQDGVVEGGQIAGTFTAHSAGDGLAIDTRVSKMSLQTAHGPIVAEDFGLIWDGKALAIEELEARVKSALVAVQGSVTAAGVAALDVAVKDYGLAIPASGAPPARAGARAPAPALRAHLSGRGKLTGPLSRPTVDAEMVLDDLEVPGSIDGALNASLKGRVSYRDGRAVLRGELRTTDVVCPISGAAPVALDLKAGSIATAQGPIEMDLKVPRTNAALLAVLVPSQVGGATGAMQMALKVSGTWDAPRFEGDLDLDAKAVKTRGGTQVTNVKAGLVFDRDRIAVKRFTGTLMGGALAATGVVPLPGSAVKYDLKGTLNGVRHRTAFMDLTNVNTSVSISGTEKMPVVAGLMKFDKGQVNIAAETDEDSPTLKQWLLSLPLNDPTLNVKCDVPSSLWIKSPQLDAELRGALVLSGRASDYHIRGELETVRGDLFFRQKRIRISEGSIKFMRPQREDMFGFSDLDDPTKGAHALDASVDAPYVNLKGQTEVDRVRIFVEAKGFAYNNGVKLNLRSLPQLEDNQIVSLLVTGRNNFSDLQGGDVGSLVTSTIGSEVVGSLVDRRVEAGLQKAFKLDDFRVNSGLFQLGNRDERQQPSVSVGKYLAPNLYVAADGKLDSGAGFLQRVELDLKLDRTVALTVEKAMANSAVSGNFFDKANYQGITANETRFGISKQLKW